MSVARVAKVASMGIIFSGSLIFGLGAYFLVFPKVLRFRLSLILSFGAGILIGTTFVHILPEAQEGWDIPVFTPLMSLCLGIFLVYLVEELAHFFVCHEMHPPPGDNERDGHTHGIHVQHEEPPKPCDSPAAYFLAKTVLGDDGYNRIPLVADVHHEEPPNQGDESPAVHTCPVEISGSGEQMDNQHRHNNGGSAEQQTELLPSNPQSEPKAVRARDAEAERGAGVHGNGTEKEAARWLSLAGLVAISFHALLEGLPVGLGRQASDVWSLCGAVATYKLVIAFCFGMEVRNASSSPCKKVKTPSSPGKKFIYILIFAGMTPLGIAVGWAVTELANDPSQAESSSIVRVLQSIAGGALFYVAFIEIICRERAKFSGKGLMQLAAVFAGFVTVVLLEIIGFGHDHSYAPTDYHYRQESNETMMLPMWNSNRTML